MAWRRPGRLIETFGTAREGVAAVEFALILPFLLLLYMGALELSQAITADRRVSILTGAIGDLVARTNPATQPLTNARLQDYFKATEAILSPFDATLLRQVVTLVAVNKDGVLSFQWSCPYNGAAARTAADAVVPPNNPIVPISKNSWIIVSEASYPHQPIFTSIPLLGDAFDAFDLYHEFYHLPRYAQFIPKPC